jgi:uncharacterized repeat protein (TIGR01451 family)
MRQFIALASAALVFQLAACGGGSPPNVDISVSQLLPSFHWYNSATPSGGPISFSFIVQNRGTDPAANVQIQISLGTNLNLVSVICDRLECFREAGPTMVVSSLPAGEGVLIYVNAVEQSRASFDATATLTASAIDDVLTDNNTLTIIRPVWNADLSVTYSVQPTTVAGGTARFVATVHNHGPDTAFVIRGDAVFPPGIAVVPEGCQGTCDMRADGSFEIPLGAEQTFAYSVTAPASAAELSSRFSVVPYGDPNTSNNSAEATTIIGP